MSFIVAVAIALAIWFIGRLVLKRYLRHRRKTQSGQEWQQYKAKLPGWVKQIEMLVWVVLWVPLMLAFIILLMGANSAAHPAPNQPNGVSVGLIVISSAFAALIPALLLGNVISWQLPPVRNANLVAMQGFATVSYRSATKGLVKFGSIVIPLSLAVAALAIFAPWA